MTLYAACPHPVTLTPLRFRSCTANASRGSGTRQVCAQVGRTNKKTRPKARFQTDSSQRDHFKSDNTD